ncbi:hypothetical protein ZYGR_0AD03930 [Zygosaccharomyces rouxii]|uniref:DNA 3'-5' helicase n=2 Tax=Zygosaccharomyces rouxii TaxID=4956 RepID=C5E0S5_ZYGRC|nr:uncharacterized protein ZYRO0G15224g [Zygosaccharomyces rouxii]KAH9202703.1 P-loop containing nucleoside triphosphate hydrolase protein [Zygosaccharomyces rouxii]GAV51210.1 hypothetical protein ZYGR_0AD03930 [Zygosaccharomyces rouxii]CAR29709.1 ZYRO0G15224p [Zygosaccharomyces rouxii]
MADNAVLEQIFSSLNLQQQVAAKYDPDLAVQVIAGPGTGKTKVLTSRVAYLMLHHKIRPQDIIVTTFTNKAAKEMIDRLVSMLRDTSIRVSDLMIGTFHSVCLRILSRYGHRIGLMKDWRIIDEKEIEVIVHNMVEKMPDQIRDYSLSLRRKVNLCLPKNGSDEWTVSPKLVKKQIERIKSYALLPEEYKGDNNHDSALAYFFENYQNELNRLNALDFDDLLMYTFRLLTREKCLPRIRHVLVDEFQDTNGIQMDLMFLFARGNHHLSRGITVVGDPDQSIYAFRNALAYNFQEMFRRCPIECSSVVLVENYRSSQKILDTSETLIRQQTEGRTDRLPLRAQYDCIFAPVYLNFPASFLEAPSIVREMLYLKSLPNLFSYDDFAILVRQRRQIKKIETALIEHRVPYKILKGHAFWELKETTSMINLLKCVYSENEKNAMIAALQYPARGIGPATAERLRTIIESKDISPFDTLKRIREGRIKFDMIGKARSSLIDFVNMIEACKKLREAPIDVALKEIFDKLYESSGMKQEYCYFDGKKKADRKPDSEPNYLNPRHRNVLVLRDYFLGTNSGNENGGVVTDSVDNTVVSGNNDKSDPMTNLNSVMEHFRNFFVSLTIYSNDTEESEEANAIKKQKYSEGLVTVSTIHGAKGLEWPVVFIPGCEEGIIPSLFGDGRSSNLEGDDDEDSENESDEEQKSEKPVTDNNSTKKKTVVPDDSLNEERRMFFVAQTRAKHLLYLSSVTDRDGRVPAVPSRFLTKELLSTMVDKQRALESVAAIKALYGNVGKKWLTSNSTFSLKQVVDDYTEFVENRRERFIWAGSIVRAMYQCNIQRNTTPTNLTSEFTTAAVQLKTGLNSPEKIKTVSPERYAPSTDTRPGVASPTKKHAPMTSTQTPPGSPNKRKSFAPSYIPSRNGPNALGVNRRLFAPSNERPQLQKEKSSPTPLSLQGSSQKKSSPTRNWNMVSTSNEGALPMKSENSDLKKAADPDPNHSNEDLMDFPASDDELMAISDLKSKKVSDSAMVDRPDYGLTAVAEPKRPNIRKPGRKLVAAPIDISEKSVSTNINDEESQQKSRFFVKDESENTTAAELLHNPDDMIVDNRPIIANAKTLADAVRETSAGSQKGRNKVKKEPTPSQYDIFSQLNNAKKKAKMNDGEIIVID